ncbi:endoplasmic reticulum-Golgi intermediate compartment protein 2 isoform X2 [Eupeodes corollae]|uniref:endoplasmic reticulum-Golgi intermediate compartment protein 2 isoform X2 n=1 Tax=Eupeodes corollae TaxID=290404 RepID=UPI00248F6FD5|nr:endoplasmic reticulum-Golgi intermediate compartment protein 2 isoform X2 [Eupeodes corollae]
MSEITTLRYRRKNNIIELAKNLDAFKKVPEKYTETTEIGGTLSLLSRILVVYLIYKEVSYYYDANPVFKFKPDLDMDDKVQFHVDITVAMPCTSLSGVDLMDETQQDVFAYGTLQREDTWWEMSDEEKSNFELVQHMNIFLREEYHSVADILFKDILKNTDASDVPITPRKVKENEQHDACRLHGTLGINKVAGVLNIVGGSTPIVELVEDHWMIDFKRTPLNFTHRINRLSFGSFSRRIVQPLEGDERIIDEESTTAQYFIKIVPTEIQNTFSTFNTYQYSVTENIRKLDSSKNSYGSPGIYFKYDWSAIKVIVQSDRDNVVQFAVRLCSIIAGIIIVSGIINSLLVGAHKMILSIMAPQVLKHEFRTPLLTDIPQQVAVENNLISNANRMASNVMPVMTVSQQNFTSQPNKL